MMIRHGKYYLMWSEGGWTGPNYSVAYAIADSMLGPFKRIGKILPAGRGRGDRRGPSFLIKLREPMPISSCIIAGLSGNVRQPPGGVHR